MTLRQALAALEGDRLIRASRGRGTFVSENPVDINLGNLSSFAEQMRLAGIAMTSRILDVSTLSPGVAPNADSALGVGGDLQCLTRLRLVKGEPIALQRSYFDQTIGALNDGTSTSGGAMLVADSLYESIEAVTGWTVVLAKESITAVGLDNTDAELLQANVAQPALLSIRTSFNQFDQPFLYDEALLVGQRCTISADRTSDRLSLRYGMNQGTPTGDEG